MNEPRTPEQQAAPLTKDDVCKLTGVTVTDMELRYVNDNLANHGPSAAKDAEYVGELIHDLRVVSYEE